MRTSSAKQKRTLNIYIKKIKSVLINILVLIVTIVIFLILIEGLCRLFPLESQIGRFINLTGSGSVYEQDSEVLYKLKVNCQEILKQPLSRKEYNCDGFRDYKEFKSQKTKFRVALVGDSFSRGSAHPRNKSKAYYFILENKLKESFTTENIEVYNFGMGGYSTEQEFYMIKNKVLNYNPDLIILQYFINDFVDMRKVFESKFLIPINAKIGAYNRFPVPLSISFGEKTDTFLITNFESYRRLLLYIENIKPKLKYRSSKKVDPDKMNLMKYLYKIAAISKNKDIPLIIIFFPGVGPYESVCSDKSLHKNWYFIENDSELQQAAALIINICGVQKDYDWKMLKPENDNDLPAHYNRLGNEMIANSTVTNIMNSDLFELISIKIRSNYNTSN